jgi:phosphoglucosamine mutase
MVDELGNPFDGDQLLYVLASARKTAGSLAGPVVGTVMSNLGLEHALREQDIDFRRAGVGDRYVLEMLRETGGTLGGETSGHLICLDQTTTGDGLVAALQVLATMKRSGKTLSQLVQGMSRYPQILLNVRTSKAFDLNGSAVIREAVLTAETELAGRGRVLLRASGTEAVIRVMVEGENETQVQKLADRLAAAVEKAAG